MKSPLPDRSEGLEFPRRGEIWKINLNPITPSDPHLPRPVLIISPNNRNKHWDSVIVVPLSTGLTNPNPRFHKEIPTGQGGIAKDSYARCDLVSNLEKTCLDPAGPLGPTISDKYVWEVVRGIRVCIGDNPDL